MPQLQLQGPQRVQAMQETEDSDGSEWHSGAHDPDREGQSGAEDGKEPRKEIQKGTTVKRSKGVAREAVHASGRVPRTETDVTK